MCTAWVQSVFLPLTMERYPEFQIFLDFVKKRRKSRHLEMSADFSQDKWTFFHMFSLVADPQLFSTVQKPATTSFWRQPMIYTRDLTSLVNFRPNCISTRISYRRTKVAPLETIVSISSLWENSKYYTWMELFCLIYKQTFYYVFWKMYAYVCS